VSTEGNVWSQRNSSWRRLVDTASLVWDFGVNGEAKASVVFPAEDPEVGGLQIVIDGSGSTITTGIKGDVRVPFACTLTGWTILADQSGAIVIDVWRDTLANFPPTDADSITNGNEPEIAASGTNAEDTDLSNWTDVTLDAGDILRFNVDSVSSFTRVTLLLHMTKTS
jgi:hypothetical protein